MRNLAHVQVHEKSILLVLLPVTLLGTCEPQLALWLPCVATFSIWPLLKKDGLAVAYAACLMLWAGLAVLLLVPLPHSGNAGPPLEERGVEIARQSHLSAAVHYGSSTPKEAANELRDGSGSGGFCNMLVKVAGALSLVAAVVVHVLEVGVAPPKGLPFLYDAVVIELSFAHFIAAAAYLNVRQWQLSGKTSTRFVKTD